MRLKTMLSLIASTLFLGLIQCSAPSTWNPDAPYFAAVTIKFST